MSTLHDGDRPASVTPEIPTTGTSPGALDHEPVTDHGVSHGRGHGLMMLACCVPMLLIAFALVVSGAAGAGAILWALLCTAMMAAMMVAMPGHRHWTEYPTRVCRCR